MKNNQKCVRLSDTTLAYIESFDGNGFNQKLENMTDYFMAHEKRLKKRVERLESEEQQLTESIKRLSAMESQLSQIKQCINKAASLANGMPLPGQLKIV